MRLWTLHPQYLDPAGLVALWREALLAQKVLAGETKGYRHHPQLLRFKAFPDPSAILATYLTVIHKEATQRGYAFDISKIELKGSRRQIIETTGQLNYEWQHLKSKLVRRAPHLAVDYAKIIQPLPHPMFRIIEGDVREWERIRFDA